MLAIFNDPYSNVIPASDFDASSRSRRISSSLSRMYGCIGLSFESDCFAIKRFVPSVGGAD